MINRILTSIRTSSTLINISYAFSRLARDRILLRLTNIHKLILKLWIFNGHRSLLILKQSRITAVHVHKLGVILVIVLDVWNFLANEIIVRLNPVASDWVVDVTSIWKNLRGFGNNSCRNCSTAFVRFETFITLRPTFDGFVDWAAGFVVNALA